MKRNGKALRLWMHSVALRFDFSGTGLIFFFFLMFLLNRLMLLQHDGAFSYLCTERAAAVTRISFGNESLFCN